MGLFKETTAANAKGVALPVEIEDGKAIVPGDKARILASYLASLKKDTLGQPLPEALNYNPQAPTEEN
jgi:hypothetical protein